MNTRSPFPPGSQVAAYFRDSGGDKQELSVPRQEDEFRRWAADNGLLVGEIFRDAARPGSSAVGRAQFEAMMRHFRSGQAGEAGVVIWNFQRFARDFDDSQFFRADLRRRGFVLHSLNDDIPEGPMGRVFEALLDWKNQQFLVDLSADISSGLRRMVLEYGVISGFPPRGFRRVPVQVSTHRDGRPRIAHRWEPDPETVPLVRQAWQMKASGATIRQIQSATGLYSSKNSWTTFWSNRLYIGVLEYADLVIEDYCEPIISRDTWDAVQAQRSAYAALQGPRHPRRQASAYLLSGLVRCARCGSLLSGLNRQRNRAYACTRMRSAYTCDLAPIPIKVLDGAVRQAIIDHVTNPEVLAAARDAVQGEMAGQDEQLVGVLAAQQARHADLRRQIERVTDAIAAAGHSSALLERLAKLEAESRTVQAELAATERSIRAAAGQRGEIDLRALAEANRQAIEAASDDQMRTILRGLVRQITVDRHDRIVTGEIEVYYPPEVKKN